VGSGDVAVFEKTMMFRKLYWVTEQVPGNSTSQVLGVYTSIPNLIRHGLSSDLDLDRIRLSLTKLDCDDGVVANWQGRSFGRLRDDLRSFIESEDFTEDQVKALVDKIEGLRSTTVPG
jgi:hypothetical protein